MSKVFRWQRMRSVSSEPITTAEVREWLKAIKWPKLSGRALEALVHQLDGLRVDIVLYNDSGDRRRREERERLEKQIADATSRLALGLPMLISIKESEIAALEKRAVELPDRYRPSPWLGASLQRDLDLLHVVIEDHKTRKQPEQKKRQAPWNVTAMMIYGLILDMFEPLGAVQFGTTPDSPSVKFIAAALARMGEHQSMAAISKCLRRRKDDVNLYRLGVSPARPGGDNNG